jgi:hypothetical protein
VKASDHTKLIDANKFRDGNSVAQSDLIQAVIVE